MNPRRPFPHYSSAMLFGLAIASSFYTPSEPVNIPKHNQNKNKPWDNDEEKEEYRRQQAILRRKSLAEKELIEESQIKRVQNIAKARAGQK